MISSITESRLLRDDKAAPFSFMYTFFFNFSLTRFSNEIFNRPEAAGGRELKETRANRTGEKKEKQTGRRL